MTRMLISQFLWVRSLGATQPGLLQAAIEMLTGAQSHSRLIWGRIHFSTCNFVGSDQFLVAVRRRASVFCWLLTGGHPQLLEATHHSVPCGPLHRQFTTWQLATSEPLEEKIYQNKPVSECDHDRDHESGNSSLLA